MKSTGKGQLDADWIFKKSEEKVIKRQKLNEACFVSILSIRAGRYVTQYAKHF